MSQGPTGLPQDILEDARALFDFNQLHHELRPCPVGIGLGSHDLGVADVTAALFHQGIFPLIVFTGANAPTSRKRFPGGEAVHYRQRAIELGVPPEAILVEPSATNTRENFELSRKLDVLCASDRRSLDEYIGGIGDRHFVINMIVGDTQRVMEYPKLGHAVVQDVPGPIEAAFERLIAAGFTDRLLSTAELTR